MVAVCTIGKFDTLLIDNANQIIPFLPSKRLEPFFVKLHQSEQAKLFYNPELPHFGTDQKPNERKVIFHEYFR